jgi:hypothetical protein
MQAVQSATSSPLSKVIFIIVVLVALYYLYQFLFASSDMLGQIVLQNIVSASPGSAYTATVGNTTGTIPAPLSGGEYTVNTWVYVNDYSVNRGQNKNILTIAGTSFATLTIFLGPYKNTLSVRVKTDDANSGELSTSGLTTLYSTLQSGSSLLDISKPCDINGIDLQKWVQVTVVLNNKTCDVYMDGKLARSCILPSFFRVDKSNTMMSICDYKGFGGFVSNTSAYNYALNPEQVWRLFMSGPGPQYSLLEYISALFDPKSTLNVGYPKQNIIG